MEGDHLKDLSVDGRIILRGRGMDWIDLPKDTDRWRALATVVINLLVA
jgi:hypothetical protein